MNKAWLLDAVMCGGKKTILLRFSTAFIQTDIKLLRTGFN